MTRTRTPRTTRPPLGRKAIVVALALAPLLAACSPDHLYANRGNAIEATRATYNDTRLSYRNADPGRYALSRLPGERGERAREERYEDARTPACDDRFALNRIRLRTPKETHLTTHRALYVEQLEHPRERGFTPRHGRNQIAQRFCEVSATLSDHSHHTIHYVVETPMGFAGVGHNVTFCIAGLDPWYVHGHRCSSLRHQGPRKAEPLPEERHYGTHPSRDDRRVELDFSGDPERHPDRHPKHPRRADGERPGLGDWLRDRRRAK